MAQEAGDPIRPTALQIVRDEGLEGKLAGKVIVITGATSGIGVETARALATTGATLFLTAHNETEVKKAETTLAEVLESGGASLILMDLASFASVRAAAADILAKSDGRVNILVNNAGIFGVRDLKLTKDGHETHFATNYLGHFLLFQLLKPALLNCSSPKFQSRVVSVGSSNHRTVELHDSDNYSFEKGGYDHQKAYPHSKLACIYMANEIDRRYGHRGLHATSLHPGGINTNLHEKMGPDFMEKIMNDPKLHAMLKTPEQGAATTVVAAIGKEWENSGGRYLEDCKEAPRGAENDERFGVGYGRQTYNPEFETRLWHDSLSIVGINKDESSQ